jgi:hypothetical protein
MKFFVNKTNKDKKNKETKFEILRLQEKLLTIELLKKNLFKMKRL